MDTTSLTDTTLHNFYHVSSLSLSLSLLYIQLKWVICAIVTGVVVVILVIVIIIVAVVVCNNSDSC